MRSDSASYCKARLLNNQYAQQDPDMATGVECASIAPTSYGAGSGGAFPRPWRDSNHHKRGTAWLFFPMRWRGSNLSIDGLWGSSGGNSYTLAAVSNAASGLVHFRVECVDGSGGACDPINPGHSGSLWHVGNGTLDKSTLHATVIFDNMDTRQGQFNPGYGRVNWTDGTHWSRTPKCHCHCKNPQDPNCPNMRCHGPALTDETAADLIRGKPWMVFIHGGEFKYYNEINANYAMLSSRVAKASDMGVLSVDFRTLDKNNPTHFPGALNDCVQAFQWLQSYGPSGLYLYGDSSGGTQVVQLLLWMAHHTLEGRNFGFTIQRAMVFSAWLDLTASSETYHSKQHCSASCEGVGDATTTSTPGSSRLHGMCAAVPYAGNLPTNLPTLSPLQAPGAP